MTEFLVDNIYVRFGGQLFDKWNVNVSSIKCIMLDSIYAFFSNVKCLNLKDQFIWLISQEDQTCLKEIARFVSHCMELRDKELDKLLCINCSQSARAVT